jgi:hypothetical protein
VGVKRPGLEADHLPPSSAEIRNAWSYTSTLHYVFMARCLVKHRDNFTFTFVLQELEKRIQNDRKETGEGRNLGEVAYNYVLRRRETFENDIASCKGRKENLKLTILSSFFMSLVMSTDFFRTFLIAKMRPL